MNTRPELKLHALLKDDFFWKRFIKLYENQISLLHLRKMREEHKIPQRGTLLTIIQKYKLITNDKRTDDEIMGELLSTTKEEKKYF